MAFYDERLFDVQVDPLCGDDLIKIRNGSTYHLSFDGCKFVRLEDTGSVPGCYQGTVNLISELPATGEACWYYFVSETDTVWYWNTLTLVWTDSGIASNSYLGLSDTSDVTYTAKAGWIPHVNNTTDALDLVGEYIEYHTGLTVAPSTPFTIFLGTNVYENTNVDIFINGLKVYQTEFVVNPAAMNEVTITVPYNIIDTMIIEVKYKSIP